MYGITWFTSSFTVIFQCACCEFVYSTNHSVRVQRELPTIRAQQHVHINGLDSAYRSTKKVQVS